MKMATDSTGVHYSSNDWLQWTWKSTPGNFPNYVMSLRREVRRTVVGTTVWYVGGMQARITLQERLGILGIRDNK